MNVIKTEIPDVLIFEPKVFGDERGFFMESFNQKVFEEAVGRKVEFVQDNHSKSTKGVLRGLHYQLEPYAQGKLVRCVVGEVFDVAVDIRKSSPTFGKWVGVICRRRISVNYGYRKDSLMGFAFLVMKQNLSTKQIISIQKCKSVGFYGATKV
ncbi:dTDP-4-dehydrorhamnose 3,5-epimerase RfbC [Escherichia coli]|nr:dTDP-4-dehydrorhamnose 3,5-epimerase RfbC [Escherichia coli]